MAQPLLPTNKTEYDGHQVVRPDAFEPQAMADLKIFWGPEICRLEYLLHLLDTGRVKEDGSLAGA